MNKKYKKLIEDLFEKIAENDVAVSDLKVITQEQKRCVESLGRDISILQFKAKNPQGYELSQHVYGALNSPLYQIWLNFLNEDKIIKVCIPYLGALDGAKAYEAVECLGIYEIVRKDCKDIVFRDEASRIFISKGSGEIMVLPIENIFKKKAK